MSKNKVATQYATIPNDPEEYRPGNAVDRKMNTCMRTQEIGSTSLEQTTWWKVDLGGVYSIYSVNIQFQNYKDAGTFYLPPIILATLPRFLEKCLLLVLIYFLFILMKNKDVAFECYCL